MKIETTMTPDVTIMSKQSRLRNSKVPWETKQASKTNTSHTITTTLPHERHPRTPITQQ